MASALDIIKDRFGRPQSVQPDSVPASGETGSQRPYLVATFAQEPGLTVVVIMDKAATPEARKKHPEACFWTAEELVWFTERYYRLEEGIESSQWRKLDTWSDDITENALRGHFLTVCHAKREFNAFLTNRFDQNS